MMEAKVWEPGESSGGAQNRFRTFKGDFLEEGAFVMDLKVCIEVCQWKEDMCRHASSTHSFSRYFSRPPINQALCWPMLGTRSNSGSHLTEALQLVGNSWAESVPAQGDWRGNGEKEGLGSSEEGGQGLPTIGGADAES